MKRFWLPTAVVAAALSVSASMSGAADFYNGKTITLNVGSGAGGGFDTYARTVGLFLGKHIPGNPTIKVVNRPGAGGRKNANLLYIRDAKDGTVIGLLGPWLVLEPLWEQTGVQFDPPKFNWLMSLAQETSTCIFWKRSGIESIEDLIKKKKANSGASGPTSSMASDIKVLNSVLGLDINLIVGFKGSRRAFLAAERGELDGLCGLWYSSVQSRYMGPINEGRAKIILQLGNRRHPQMKDVPFLADVAKDLPDVDKKALSLIFSQMDMARPFIAPPGVPKDRVEILRKAFAAVVKDPEFQVRAKKTKLAIEPVSGAQIQQQLAAMYAFPKEVVARARQIIGR